MRISDWSSDVCSSDLELAVRRAEAQLATVGQSIGASPAAVATAQAKLVEAVAQRDNARDQSARLLELIKRGVYPEARRQEALTTPDSADAGLAQAESALEEARQALGHAGAENPTQIGRDGGR